MGFFDLSPSPSGSNDLADSLIEVADQARQIATDLGVRDKRVFLLWVGWVPGKYGPLNSEPFLRDEMRIEEAEEAVNHMDLDPDIVGVGKPVLLCEYELLPTPLVSPMGGVSKNQDAVGLTERGGLTVSEISARYSEDFLMGLIPPFRTVEKPDTLKPGIDFWYEIRENRGAGFIAPGYIGAPDQSAGNQLPPLRRRFHVSATPNRAPDRAEWVVGLRRADGGRSRMGSLSTVG